MNALSTTFYELLDDNLAIRPDKIALIDGQQVLSYSQLASQADMVSGYLENQGIEPGDRVIVHLRKSIPEVVAMFAVAKRGAVIVNVNIQSTVEQLLYIANDCGAKCIITDSKRAGKLALMPLPLTLIGVLVDGPTPDGERFTGWSSLDPGSTSTCRHRPDTELAMIIYTSGSTGMPKGVMLSHRNIISGARSVARYLELQSDERLLSVLPYSFDYGLNQLTTVMLMGATIVHQTVPIAAEIVSSMQRYRITGLAAVPPLWSQIVRVMAQRPVALPCLRRITNSGGKIPLNILAQMPQVFPQVNIYLMYGLTEAFRSTFLAPAKFEAKMGAIGQAIPGNEVFVVKPGVGLAKPGEEGELVHRGPLVSMGYWGRPEVTREKIRPCPELAFLIGNEPVVYSGDTVRIDADGDLWFVARNDAMIKTSGFRVSPDEVEDLVSRSGLVEDVVAFAVDDDELGQVVHVAVTPFPGVGKERLMQHCRTVMPPYMLPRELHLWDGTMPRTSSGKLSRPEVVRGCKERMLGPALQPGRGAENMEEV